jgi:hypothetical protein
VAGNLRRGQHQIPDDPEIWWPLMVSAEQLLTTQMRMTGSRAPAEGVSVDHSGGSYSYDTIAEAHEAAGGLDSPVTGITCRVMSGDLVQDRDKDARVAVSGSGYAPQRPAVVHFEVRGWDESAVNDLAESLDAAIASKIAELCAPVGASSRPPTAKVRRRETVSTLSRPGLGRRFWQLVASQPLVVVVIGGLVVAAVTSWLIVG